MSELLPDISMASDVNVTDVTDDSRAVSDGSLFLAVPGAQVDGRNFIRDAAARGAAAILAETPVPAVEIDVPFAAVEGLAARRGEIASRFFGAPSEQMSIVAVTGTNGKTSCSHFIAQALAASGRRCGVMGTLGYGFPGSVADPGLTTPGAIETQRRLAALLSDGADCVALEASSHGIAQDRLAGTDVDIAVFTNITRDHLDYHDTFAEYKAVKRRLFSWQGLEAAVINRDDDFGEEFASASRAGQVLDYSTRDSSADVYCSSLDFRPDGFDAEVVTPWGSGSVSSRLLAEFNASNLLTAITVLGLMENDIEDICRWASEIQGVPGRMDLMKIDAGPAVVIDYAHTPDALEKALDALNRHKHGRLYCLVGCGGDRDTGKRPLMGSLAARLADEALLTSDNPRSEDPAAIIEEMMAGIGDLANVRSVPDRAEAIRVALGEAGPGDIVLIAGKGHEDYQEVDGRRVPFSDYEVVRKYFEGKRGGGA